MIRRLAVGKNIARGFASAESPQTSKFTVVPAIERSPTDLLKALSGTVGTDTTAPHFAFIDDPITIPSTQNAKRNYFMAKEMGKRAARDLAAEWPTLFAFDRDQPRLPVFRPEHSPDPLKVDPTEKNLLAMIQSRQVEDCCILYERMRSENIEVTEKVQLELFRLVAYYNSKNIPFAEWEDWAGMRNFGEDSKNPWKSAGVADLLFETLSRSDESVSIMIAGLCKFPSDTSVEQAKQLFKEHTSTGGKVYLEAFNGLIATSNFKNARVICSDMAKMGIHPDANTFSSILTSAGKLAKFEERVKAFAEVMGEMRTCRVDVTLENYSVILKSLVVVKNEEKERNEEEEKVYQQRMTLAISWVSQILDEIEKNPKILNVTSKNCHSFFVEAMGIAYKAANLEIGQKLVKLYESDANNVELPAFTSESIFYNRYLQLFIEQSSSIEQIHKTYRDFVPRLVGVSPPLSTLVYQKLARQSHWPLLRRLIKDGISGGQMNTILGEEMRRNLINVQFHTLSVAERDEYRELVQKLVSVWVEFSKFTDVPRMQRKLAPVQISDCALLLTRVGEDQKAYELLELLLDEEASVGDEATVMGRGHARQSSMAELFEDALRKKDPYGASICLQILSLTNNRGKLEPLANRIFERCYLTDEQKRIIQGFVRLRPQ